MRCFVPQHDSTKGVLNYEAVILSDSEGSPLLKRLLFVMRDASFLSMTVLGVFLISIRNIVPFERKLNYEAVILSDSEGSPVLK
jgi:hypothetical protein